MIEFIIPLLAEFLNFEFLRFWFFPFFALAFVATVPAIIRAILR